MKTLLKKVLGGMAVSLAMATGAHAALLSTLIAPNGSITAGDKLFDNWTVAFYDSNFGKVFNADNIDVLALNDGGLDPGPGLDFDVLANELLVNGDAGYSYIDLQLRFRVSVLDPGLKIKDNSLRLTEGFKTIAGDNGFYIREDIGTANGASDLGSKDVEFSWLDGMPPLNIENLFDSAEFAPQGELWVTKNILVWADGQNVSAGLRGFEQRFSQVPEPASFGLAGVALLAAGFAGRTRRRSRAVA